MQLPTLPSLPRLTRRTARGRAVTGLDVEPGAIRAAAARVQDGRLVVERTASVALAPGILRDGEVADPDGLTAALAGLFAEHDLDRHVRIGIANQRVVVRELLLPPIPDPRQLEMAVRFLAADELPMPVDQAVLDHVALGTVDTPEGPRTRVLLVAARRTMVDALLVAARAAKLRPEGIDLAGFAMVRALGAADPAPVLHLAVGGVVNLAVARGRECTFTRVLGGGLEAMAADLGERHAVTADEARAALRDVSLAAASESGDDGTLRSAAARVVADGVRRIAGEVRNSIDFHAGTQALGQDGRVGRVVLTGPGAGLDGFAGALAERLALPVAVGRVDGDDDGRFAVAAGLAVEEVAA